MPAFQGKSFLVTGASSGIGLAIAKALAREGANVGAMARSADKLAALADTSGRSDQILPLPGDVVVEADCQRAVAETVGRFGALDGLVHSAGISMSGRVAQTRLDVFREVMEINYFAMIRLVHLALPHLEPRRGHVVAISSVAGFVSYPFGSGYAASKHALQAFMDALRVEMRPANVHVLSVCPGYVRTDIARNSRRPDGTSWGATTREIERGLSPEAVAAVTLDAMEGRKRQIFPAGPMETAGRLLKPVAPAVVDMVMARMFAESNRREQSAASGGQTSGTESAGDPGGAR